MEIENLRMFIRLSETLHFGQTGKEFHLSPSAFSRTIQRMETELGQTLLVRDKKKVRLTPEGVCFRDYCYKAILEWDLLAQQMVGSRPLDGELSLFCSVTSSYSMLPALLNRFRVMYPNVHVRLEIGNAYAALDQVLTGKVDASVSILPPQLPSVLYAREILATPLVFISPTSPCPVGDLIRQKPIPVDVIPFILPQPGMVRDLVDRWFTKKNVVPQIYSQSVGNEAIPALVSLGCGVGVVPKLVVEKSPLHSQVRVLHWQPVLPEIQVGVCILKTSLEALVVKAFWESIGPLHASQEAN